MTYCCVQYLLHVILDCYYEPNISWIPVAGWNSFFVIIHTMLAIVSEIFFRLCNWELILLQFSAQGMHEMF